MTGVHYVMALEDVGVAAGFDMAALAGEDLTPLMDKIGSALIAGAQERIGTTNVSPDGVDWPKSLRAKESGGLTLHDTGRLMRSITAEANDREVRVGSNLIYAGVHQAGATIRPVSGDLLSFTLANGTKVVCSHVTIPARPYLGISIAEGETITELVGKHFDNLLNGRAA